MVPIQAEARLYSESQPCRLARCPRESQTGSSRSDLSGAISACLDLGRWYRRLRDLPSCKAFPELGATVVDFPNVAAIGREFVDKAGLGDRIHYIEADGLKADWPRNQDVILMSYLLSGIPGETHEGLIKRAYDHLAPGGTLLIHDFIVCADRTGPKLAALWQLQHTAFTPQARSVDDAWLVESMERHGFRDASVETMIPEMTMLAKAVKPA